MELPPAAPTHLDDLKNECECYRSRAALLEYLPTVPDEAELGEDGNHLLYAMAQAARVDLRALALQDVEGHRWAAGQVRGAIAAIAVQAGQDADRLLAEATEEAKREAHGARYTLRKAQGEVAAMEQERQLPDGDALDRILRYEGHLNRQLLHTLHELEALQARRRGGMVPLARIDVSGLAGK